jgi:hypothetical protein
MEEDIDGVVPYIPKTWRVSWDPFSDVPDKTFFAKPDAAFTNPQR